MSALFIAAFPLGLLFNAAPGAVFAETVRQGVPAGFRRQGMSERAARA